MNSTKSELRTISWHMALVVAFALTVATVPGMGCKPRKADVEEPKPPAAERQGP